MSTFRALCLIARLVIVDSWRKSGDRAQITLMFIGLAVIILIVGKGANLIFADAEDMAAGADEAADAIEALIPAPPADGGEG